MNSSTGTDDGKKEDQKVPEEKKKTTVIVEDDGKEEELKVPEVKMKTVIVDDGKEEHEVQEERKKKTVIVGDDGKEEEHKMPEERKKKTVIVGDDGKEEEHKVPEKRKKKTVIVLDDDSDDENINRVKVKIEEEAPNTKRKSGRLAKENPDRSTNQAQNIHGDEKSATPQFSLVIEASNLHHYRCSVKIPFEFAAACGLLNGLKEVSLEDPAGRAWEISLHHYNRPHGLYFGKGWLGFARVNRLRVGSKCIFQSSWAANATKPTITVKILNNGDMESDHQCCSVKKKPLGGDGAKLKRKKGTLTEGTFELRIRAFNLKHDFMHIPSGFLRSNGLTKCKEFRIRGMQGKTWDVSVNHHSTPCWRAYFWRGWRDFAHENKLEAGCRCVFGLVPDQENTLRLQNVIGR